ncbi:MAG TPA: methyltransferase domain-containing protein [Streptosporangiaceae bacterium]
MAAAQRARWLPRKPSRVLDLSGPGAASAAQAAAAGHRVLLVREPENGERPTTAVPRPQAGGSVSTIRADATSLSFLSDASIDAVIADDRALSRHLLAEMLVTELARVLRPGGRVIASTDSLMFGMAMLAGQESWAQLSDVPSAEVVLIPWPDGTFTRCFGADQLRELFSDAGLEVEWIRSRTMLSPSTVEGVLGDDPEALRRLVRAELQASRNDDSVGIHLVVSARRPG